MRKLFALVLSMAISVSLYAQTRTVTGVVKDAGDSSTLPGVNVAIKGSNQGVVSDEFGKYEIKADSKDVLVFSFVGYTTKEMQVGSQSVINVSLQTRATGLDEVVVTALGIKRESKKLGYAVTEVKGEELAQTNTISPVAALQGKVAGVEIAGTDGGLFGGTKIQIRGVSTLGKNNQPIFVIDGVIMDNGTSGGGEWSSGPGDWGNELKNLNSDDFESVSVLKGSAATALYGSRGINGAVIITTKSGKKQKGIGISFSQTTGIDYVYDTPHMQYEFGPGKYSGDVDYGEKDGSGAFYKFDTRQIKTTTFEGETVPTLIGASSSTWGPKFDGRDILGYDNKLTNYQGYKDNMKDAYEMGFSSNTNIALQGGTDKSTFYISQSYNYRKGTYPRNTFKRNSILFKGTHEFTDWFKMEASVNYTESNPKNPAGSMGHQFVSGGFRNVYDTEKYKDLYTADHGGYPQNKYGDELGNVPSSKFWFQLHNNNTEREEKLVRPIVRAIFKPYSWATLTFEGNANLYSYRQEVTKLGSDRNNEGTNNDKGGYYSLKHYQKQQKTGKVSLNLHHKIDDFDGSLVIGGETFSQENSSTEVKTDGGLIVPGQYFITNSKKNIKGSGKISGEKQINSLYFLFNIGWKNQAFIDITGRNDWSSSLVYADGGGTNSYFYPSVSASWLFTETLELPEWVSFGKIRLSYAEVGNDTSPYTINKGYKINKIEMDNSKFIYTNTFDKTLVDPDLKPERKKSYSFGTDIRFFKNRLGIDFTWYKENTYDQIVSIPMSSFTGMSNQLVNAGNIENKGIELAINTTPVKIGDFQWDLNFTYTKNENKIVSLHDDIGEYKTLAGNPSYGNYRVGSVAYIGGEYGVLMSDAVPAKYQATDAEGNSIDDPKNGKWILNWSDSYQGAYFKRKGGKPEKIGSMQPDFLGSVSTSLKYKGFDLSCMIDMRFGGYVASYSNRYGSSYGYTETSLDGRNADHGGMTWTSAYDGVTYDDGVIPDGVFAENTSVTKADGSKVDVSGMTYKEAYDAGHVEPTHASFHTALKNSWGSGVVNDDWVHEVNYVSLRQVSLGYTVPNSITNRWKIRNLRLGIVGRNLGYLHNSLPNNLNPESMRGNRSDYSYIERTWTPFTATYSFSIKFNL